MGYWLWGLLGCVVEEGIGRCRVCFDVDPTSYIEELVGWFCPPKLSQGNVLVIIDLYLS